MTASGDDTPTIFFDADDTLWENAVFFRAARERWRTFAATRGHDPEIARARLREVEDAGLARRAFGSDRLLANMMAVLAELEGSSAAEPDPEVVATCEELARSIRHHPLKYYPGADEVLATLAPHFKLVMLTMGDPEEQQGKIDRTALRHHFNAIEITRDKSEARYREIHERHGSTLPSWMIGNSLSKDIGPAAAAGWTTVHFRNGAPLPPYFRETNAQPDHAVDDLRELPALFGLTIDKD